MRARAVVLALAAWTASSCGSGQKPGRHTPGPADKAFTVEVWIEDDPRLPKKLMLEGCGEWKAKRVSCVEVKETWMADIRVYADDGACVLTDDMGTPDPKDDKTRTTLAWAFSGGDIKMMMKCLTHDAANVYDAAQLRRVMGHETGHQVGIWDHVPYEPACEDAKTHPTGKKVCGLALMNPYDNPKIHFVTEIDALAFDLRDPKHSVLVSDVPRKDTPDCVYEDVPAH